VPVAFVRTFHPLGERAELESGEQFHRLDGITVEVRMSPVTVIAVLNERIRSYLTTATEPLVPLREHRALIHPARPEHAVDLGNTPPDDVPGSVIDHVPGEDVIERGRSIRQVGHGADDERQRKAAARGFSANEVDTVTARVDRGNAKTVLGKTEGVASDSAAEIERSGVPASGQAVDDGDDLFFRLEPSRATVSG